MYIRGALAFFPAAILHFNAIVEAAASLADWSALNRTLDGRLQEAAPQALPCFSQSDKYSHLAQASTCAVVQANYTSAAYRLENFSSYMNTQDEECAPYSKQQCLLDPTQPSSSQAFTNVSCNQGAIPPYFVELQGPQDVQDAFAFTETTGTPISIKNTGHDYNGRSSGPGTLGLWTHGLQNLTYHSSFIASGCAPNQNQSDVQAITTGAGVTFDTVYKFADQNNVTIVGGSVPTVGISGGWVQGAGHGILSPVYGLGIDRVLEFNLVGPNSGYYVANACQNQDLFWALRGGGGSTFGVVLSVTHRVEPALSLSVALISLPSNASQAVQSGFLDLIIEGTLNLTGHGWGGFLSPTLLLVATPLLSLSQAQVSLSAFSHYASLNNGAVTIESLPTWYAFYSKYVAPSAQPVGSITFSQNRLMPASLFRSEQGRDQLSLYLKWLQSIGVQPQILSTTPYLYSGNGNATSGLANGHIVPQPFAYGGRNATSSTPAWREAALIVSTTAGWAYNATLEEKLEVVNLMKEVDRRAAALTPDGGSYINEASPWTPDWKESFWGANYETLELFKRDWDPKRVLGCWHCLGNGGSDVQGAVGGNCLGKLGEMLKSKTCCTSGHTFI